MANKSNIEISSTEEKPVRRRRKKTEEKATETTKKTAKPKTTKAKPKKEEPTPVVVEEKTSYTTFTPERKKVATKVKKKPAKTTVEVKPSPVVETKKQEEPIPFPTTNNSNKPIIDEKTGDEVIEMSAEDFSALLSGNGQMVPPPEVETPNQQENVTTQTVLAGRNKTNYFYYELFYNGKNDELLSIGVIDSEGNYFYAEANDFTFADIDNDIFTSVLSKFINPSNVLEGNKRTMKGTTEEISNELIKFMNEVVTGNQMRELVAVTSVPALTYQKLLQLLKRNTDDYPKNIITVTIDVNQDMANLMQVEKPEEMSAEDWEINGVPIIVATGYDLVWYSGTLPSYKEIDSNAYPLLYANAYRAFHQFTYALV